MKKISIVIFFLLFAYALFGNGNKEHSQAPYTGGDGKEISITIKVLEAEGLPSSLSNIHVLAYRGLIENFRKYSNISVRPDMNFDQSLYKELLSGYYSDDDAARSDLGHLIITDYLMTGSITQSPLGYYFYLQIARTAENDKSVAFSFSANCTFSDLVNLSIVNMASLGLLEQMGVKLTERARTELTGTNAANRDRGRTIMMEADAAQRAGDEAKARALFNQAAELDAQLAQEAQRRLFEMDKPLAMLTTETIPSPVLLPAPQLQNFVPTPEKQMPPPVRTTGNIGDNARARQQAYEIEQENERIRKEIETENARIRADNERRQAEINAENMRRQAEVDAENARRQAAVAAENAARDMHNREIWVKALSDSEAYYRNYLATIAPFELVYENKIEEIPESQNFANRTLSVKFNAALVPLELRWARAVENDVYNLRSQLLATGRAEAWGLANWPRTTITYPSPFETRIGNIAVYAELLNDSGQVLGSRNFYFEWNLIVNFENKSLSFSINEDVLLAQSVIIQNVYINDITDTLQIRIVRINGEDAEKVAAQGGIQYSTDYQRWKRIERGQQRRAAQIAAREAATATGKFFLNYIVPNYIGVGTTLTNANETVKMFTTPALVLSAYNRVFFGRSVFQFYFDYGCDFGFIHGALQEIKDVDYYSFYPNAHIGFGIYDFEGDLFNFFLGVGGGYMLATYIFPNDTVNVATPSFDIIAGLRSYNIFEFSLSLRLTKQYDRFIANNKFQLGFRIIPAL